MYFRGHEAFRWWWPSALGTHSLRVRSIAWNIDRRLELALIRRTVIGNGLFSAELNGRPGRHGARDYDAGPGESDPGQLLEGQAHLRAGRRAVLREAFRNSARGQANVSR